MELIPILSLIILVATISTFILAVGAYILYKIRERKGKVAQAPQPAAIPAELVSPAPLMAEQGLTQSRRTYAEERTMAPEYGRQPVYMTAHEEVQRSGPEMRPTYVTPPAAAASYSQEGRYQKQQQVTKTTAAEGKKFMRYTQEGYVDPGKEKEAKKKEEKESLKWR